MDRELERAQALLEACERKIADNCLDAAVTSWYSSKRQAIGLYTPLP